ncbi:MAG: hypothetical protein ACXVC6_00675 [Bacteroidia bacterium]
MKIKDINEKSFTGIFSYSGSSNTYAFFYRARRYATALTATAV